MVGVANSGNYIHLLVDELYFSALHDDEELFPISDEKYAFELQLQEALMSSSAIISTSNSESSDFQIHHHFNSMRISTLKGKGKETGECSNSQSEYDHQDSLLCLICMDVKQIEEMFRSNTCSHWFCTDCISKYVAAKLQDNISMIKCPDLNCKAALEPQICRSIVPKEVFDRWENALCESLILGSQKFYCPFKDCSAMLVNDEGVDMIYVVESECPNCHRLFCAQCKVAWHAGISCNEFKNLSKDQRSRELDILVMELAKNKKWRRCPNCNMYVEKTQGCLHITCRCGAEFCYGCGLKWNSSHSCR